MATTITVSKKTVSEFLSSGDMNPFVIPEYQRPYAWEEDQIQTMFDDLWEFSASTVGQEQNKTKTFYFLGSIVLFKNNSVQEIIDGQQRITSLFLLLRAIYTKLDLHCGSSDKVNYLKSQIRPTLWHIIDVLEGRVDKASPLLTSKVVNDNTNDILSNILETGSTKPDATDKYSKNYLKFQELLDTYSQNAFVLFLKFVYVILYQTIVLPIESTSEDDALMIFSRLNDRGLPLSVSDIFKAQMYNQAGETGRQEFIDFWKELDERATYVSESIQQLFYYYMFYLRAQEKDNKTTTPGLQKYYSAKEFEKLRQKNLLGNLMTILNLWQVVNNHEPVLIEQKTGDESIQYEPWSEDKKIRKALDILTSYPNEFWKYPVVIYYLTHRENDNFTECFLCFLHKLIVELMTRYLKEPTISAVKAKIMKLDVEILDNLYPNINFEGYSIDKIKEYMTTHEKDKVHPHRNMVRMLLKILAYDYEKQTELLPEKWEIEHIFPVRYDNVYFQPFDENCIDYFGNKLPFEKRLNIRASNGYFTSKKREYQKSAIQITKDMGYDDKTQCWDDKCILQRDEELANAIVKIFDTWNKEYAQKQA